MAGARAVGIALRELGRQGETLVRVVREEGAIDLDHHHLSGTDLGEMRGGHVEAILEFLERERRVGLVEVCLDEAGILGDRRPELLSRLDAAPDVEQVLALLEELAGSVRGCCHGDLFDLRDCRFRGVGLGCPAAAAGSHDAEHKWNQEYGSDEWMVDQVFHGGVSWFVGSIRVLQLGNRRGTGRAGPVGRGG